MQKTARRYSITFLLIGSIVLASPLHAAESGDAHNNSAFLAVFTAEFALAQHNVAQSLDTYQDLVMVYNLPNINQRALEVALEVNDISAALDIAKRWHQRYPTDVPAMFYLAHLALRAQQYTLAAHTLDQILSLDANADLEGILDGIYPESIADRQALLLALNHINQHHHPSLLVMVAGLEAQNEQYGSALSKVNAALQQRPNVASFIILKANLLFASNQPTQALKWLDSNSLKQSSSDVGLFEVQYLIRQNQTLTALSKLKTLLGKWPTDEQLQFLAGITSIDLKQYEQAESYLAALQHADNYRDQANYYLAVNAERKKDFVDAIELYKAVDGHFYTVSRKNLVAIYLAANNSGDAIRFLTQERVSHPHQASFLYQLQAQILDTINQKPRAIALLDEAIQQMPDDAELIYAQVLLFDPFLDKDRLDQALNKLLDIEPNSPTFLNAYAYTLALQNRKLDIARKYAEKALSYAPQQASILDTLGYIAFLQNDLATAVKALAEAYALSPNLSIGLRYAKALYISGDMSGFKSLCQTLQKNYPHDPEVMELLHLLLPDPPAKVS
jgi:tetratricopeptide (TPR) repeat protein